MKAFLIEPGTTILAALRDKEGRLDVKKKTTTKEAMYFLEDVVIDPLNPNQNPSERLYAVNGYYGFKLPSNKVGYELLICHSSKVVVR